MKMVKSAVEVMDRQLNQLVRLVDDLLDVSRISRGKIELRRERVSVRDIIDQAVETSLPSVHASKQQLEISLPEGDPIYLDADATRLAQVFGNLINNASRYSAPGSTIWLSVERKGNQVTFSVKDQGIGIPLEMLPRIFDMFTQVHQQHDQSLGGLGIGLSLVRNLIALHGGQVEARSEGPGKGSEFVVTLPLNVSSRNVPIESAGSPVQEVKSKRILVVDDNRDAADTLSRLLTFKGNETRVAHDGHQALIEAEDFKPEIVLLDIGLPKLSGHEVARKLRATSHGKDVVLVALTGWGQEEDRLRSKEAGFDAHLVKPVEYRQLMELLSNELASRS
jgi:CheY-like chemotaxis protein/two-component sensor histidine kinase